MNIGITTNVSDLIGRWQGRAAAVPREQRTAAREIAPVVKRESQRVLRVKLYGVPVHFNRTGDLIGKEEAHADGMDVVLSNASAHAAFRRALGTPGGRRIRTPGIVALDWQREAVMNKRGFILQARAAANRRALETR